MLSQEPKRGKKTSRDGFETNRTMCGTTRIRTVKSIKRARGGCSSGCGVGNLSPVRCARSIWVVRGLSFLVQKTNLDDYTNFSITQKIFKNRLILFNWNSAVRKTHEIRKLEIWVDP